MHTVSQKKRRQFFSKLKNISDSKPRRCCDAAMLRHCRKLNCFNRHCRSAFSVLESELLSDDKEGKIIENIDFKYSNTDSWDSCSEIRFLSFFPLRDVEVLPTYATIIEGIGKH